MNISRDSEVHSASELNPFGYIVEYEVDPAIVLNYPRRICIGAVTPSPRDTNPDDDKNKEVTELIRSSLVAHAHMRFDDAGIALSTDKPDEDAITAALDGCSYLLSAELIRADEFYTLFWSRRRLGIEVRLTDLDTDQTLWTARHVDARNAASMPLDPVSLAAAMFRAQDFANDKDILPSMVDDVVRRLFATFPALPKGQAAGH